MIYPRIIFYFTVDTFMSPLQDAKWVVLESKFLLFHKHVQFLRFALKLSNYSFYANAR